MLEYFPDPHPDEILYSVWARYSDHTQYPSQSDVFRELFGRRLVHTTVDLPRHLDHFVSCLPSEHSYTLDWFIAHHTLLPFHGPFLPQEQFKRLRDQMTTNDSSVFSKRRLGGLYPKRPHLLGFVTARYVWSKTKYTSENVIGIVYIRLREWKSAMCMRVFLKTVRYQQEVLPNTQLLSQLRKLLRQLSLHI